MGQRVAVADDRAGGVSFVLEANLEVVERQRQTAADAFGIGLLVSPKGEEERPPTLDRGGRERRLLSACERRRNRRQIDIWANALEIDADLSFAGDREESQIAGVGKVESKVIANRIIRHRRLPLGA